MPLINIFIETSGLMAHGFHDGMEIVKHKAKILLNCVYFLVKIKSSNHKIFEGCICHHPAPVQTGSIPIIYLDIAKSSGIPFKSWFNNSSIFLNLDFSFILQTRHFQFLSNFLARHLPGHGCVWWMLLRLCAIGRAPRKIFCFFWWLDHQTGSGQSRYCKRLFWYCIRSHLFHLHLRCNKRQAQILLW